MSESKAALAKRVRELEAELASTRLILRDVVNEVRDRHDYTEDWPFTTTPPRWWFGCGW